MVKLILVLILGHFQLLHAEVINFDKQKEGSKIQGWTAGFFGAKGNPKWSIIKDDSSPSLPMALLQSGEATYGWLVKNDSSLVDGMVEVDFKILSGKEDPEAGLVWRHQDGKNYYYVRANAVEDNIVFYRMHDGKKEVVKEADYKIPFKTWHHLAVKFEGAQIDILIDQKSIISIKDKVFLGAGKVGLFTTADTITSFDNFNFNKNKE